MSVLDSAAYMKLGSGLWEKANKVLDEFGRDIENGEDIEAVIKRTLGEEDAAGADPLRECLNTLLLRQGKPQKPEAQELLKKDKLRDERNRATALETDKLVLGRELEVLVRKSQSNFYLPNEYYVNEEAMAQKKKEIYSKFERHVADLIIEEATKKGLDPNQQGG